MDVGEIQQPALPALTSGVEAQAERARRTAENGRSEDAARQFETLFAMMLVRELRRAIPGGVFGQSAGADVYEGWFDEHLGQALGERDALGIAGLVRRSLASEQSDADAAAGAGGRP